MNVQRLRAFYGGQSPRIPLPSVSYRATAAIAMLLLLGCQVPPPPPPPPQSANPITNTMGVWMQSDQQNMWTSYTGLFENSVNLEYNYTAGIRFKWNDHAVFYPSDLPASGWPDVGNPQFYTEWVGKTAGSSPTDAFHLYLVGHSSVNAAIGTCGNSFTFGYSAGQNNLIDQNFPANRFTFMYGQDIDNEIAQCSKNYPNEGLYEKDLVNWAVTHELGHQRAGLTHPDDDGNYVYHTGTYGAVPNNAYDVMTRNVPLDVASTHEYAAFDMEGQTPSVNNKTCQGNLATWKTITN